MNDETYEKWVVIFRTGTDYEADLVRDRLDDSGIPAVVLTQRDHAFNLTVGDLATVNVLVPPEYADAAAELLETLPLSDAELNEAALSSDPSSPPAHEPRQEAMLDSGAEEIRFTEPEDDEDLE